MKIFEKNVEDHDEAMRLADEGDEEGLRVLVLLAPKGAMEGMDARGYHARLRDDPDFGRRVREAKGSPGVRMMEPAESRRAESPFAGCSPRGLLRLHERGCLVLSDDFRAMCEDAAGTKERDMPEMPDPDSLLEDDDTGEW